MGRTLDEQIARTEGVLRRAAKAMRKRGIRLVYGIFEEDGGACVLGALEHGKTGEHIDLPEGEEYCRAYDAIEMGFDREPPKDYPVPWYELGLRLRRSLQPAKAHSNGGSPPKVRKPLKIRFTS